MTTESTPITITRKHPLAECENCPLYEDSIFVPSYGPEQADVVLVGEAPARNEAREGKPFIGASGQLLDQILPSSGVRRADVFITNVCLCRPKDNSNPPAAAVKACKTRLLEEINSREPRVVVALGNFASQTILDTSVGITKLRVGPPKRSPLLGDEVSVIPTFHPGATLYNSNSFPDIVTDFGKIKGALHGTEVTSVWSPPELRIFDDRDGAETVLRELLNSSRLQEVGIDIEVGLDKDEDLGRPDQYHLLCIGISHRVGGAFILGENSLRERTVLDLVGKLLGSKSIIAQNGKFDLAGLYKLNPEGALRALAFDTMLAHYTIDERRGTHSLDQLAIEFLGAPDWKAEFHRHLGGSKNFADAPREILYKYCGYDVANTHQLRHVLASHMTEELHSLHDFLVRTSPVLMKMELNGLGVDVEYNQQLEQESQEIINRHLNTLREMVGDPTYNPNSWQQVGKVLKENFGVRASNTRADTLELIQERAAAKGNRPLYDFISEHLAFKKEAKSYGTYIKGIRERIEDHGDGPRVYADFLLHGTVTGRLSSRNPNLQNITRGDRLRRQFIPSSPDNVFIQADYRQAELRVVCWLARDAYFREVLSDSSRDIHSEVAERFFGKGFTKEQRVIAKAVVFGLLYGREAYSLAAEHRISVREAQDYINKFFEVIPHTVKWIEDLQERVLEGDDLVTVFGRHRRFWLITDNNKNTILKEARAFLPQSTASDFTLESANRLARMGLWDNLRIPIHDALVVEAPRSEAQHVANLVATTMQEVAEEYIDGFIPFPVDVKIGDSWGDL